MFKLSEANPDGTRDAATERELVPSPTRYEYGDRFDYTILQSAGRGIRQRTKRKTGEMKWVWENRKPSFDSVYWDLFDQQAHRRKARGLSPYVYLWEDHSGSFGTFNIASKKIEPDWIKVLITYVGRIDPSAGGPPIHTSELRFLIQNADEVV